MEKVYKLNDKARIQRFGAAILGGAAGETLVADNENIGTIGDALEWGPTQLEVDAEVDYEGGVAEDPQKDAVRKLMNRVKFGADSVMYFPFIFGGIKAVGHVAKFGKNLALSSSKINKSIDKVMSVVRPTSDKPTEMFLGKMREASGLALVINRVLLLTLAVELLQPPVYRGSAANHAQTFTNSPDKQQVGDPQLAYE